MTVPPREPVVSRPVPRKDGRDKVTGHAKYVDDLRFPGMLHGVTVRSPLARGKLKKIHFEGDLPWNEITVVMAKDLPGKNVVAHILPDQPCLVDSEIRHAEEPILLLAHADKYVLEEARKNIKLEIEPLPAILTIDDAEHSFKSFQIEKGDVDKAMQRADLVVDGEYHTGAQEQLYLEPNGMVATHNAEGITVWGSMQCPYYVHHALTTLFGLPGDQVRVIQAETGGGFGGKEDYPSILACHAALLAWKSGKPVKMIYDRAEDMAATTKRHPSRTRHKTAVAADGTLLGMDIEFVLDGGAYATLSSVVLSRGAIHAAGPYNCPNVRIRARAMATNHPPHGAFRGFGAPQSIFAIERQLDRVAAALDLSPQEFRRKNFIHKGQLTATGQEIREHVDLNGLLDTALNASEYHARISRYKEHNRNPRNRTKKGIGLAAFMHGAGFTGSGEKNLASIVAIEGTPEGKVRVLASSTEIGQGSRTVLAQIAADALEIGFDRVEVIPPDTAKVPNSGPTVASRTTMIVGKLVESAAEGLKAILQQSGLLPTPYDDASFEKACREYIAKVGALKAYSQYKQPEHIQWDDEKYQGDAYGTFAWAVYVADVEVDLVTYETKVTDFIAVQEIGKVIHPVLAEGQIEGGVAQAIGYALYEKVIWKDGRMANNRITNYIIPTSLDLPRIRVLFAENPYAYGPQGAKGIGELPMDGVAPAILNAVAFATGCEVNTIPLLPENLMEALDGGSSHE